MCGRARAPIALSGNATKPACCSRFFINSLQFLGKQEGPGRIGPSVPVRGTDLAGILGRDGLSVPVRGTDFAGILVDRLGELATAPLEIYHQAKAHGAEFVVWGASRIDGRHRLRLWVPNDFPLYLRDAIEACADDLVAIVNEFSEKTFPVLAAEAVLEKQRRLQVLLRWKREQHRQRMLRDTYPIR
jgi:hypothetical protein